MIMTEARNHRWRQNFGVIHETAASMGELWFLVRGFTVLVRLFTNIAKCQNEQRGNGGAQVEASTSVGNITPAYADFLHFVSCFDVCSIQ
jgi:hypothetical protein